MFLGDQLDTDLLTITRGSEKIEIACFKITQAISLTGTTTFGSFEPVGVVRRNENQVFTLNSYSETNSNIGLGPDYLPISGDVAMTSGDGSPQASCGAFGTTPPGDSSFVGNEFLGAECVKVNGQDGNGAPFSFETTSSKLLAGDFTQGGDSCGAFTCGDVPAGAVVTRITDSDFPDANWEVEIVAEDVPSSVTRRAFERQVAA